MKKRSPSAFTLVELLTVMVIILILAGIVMGTIGYAQKKAARSRALAEIHSMSSACESYRADNGGYPRNADTDKLDPNAAAASSITQSSTYCKSVMWLYACLSGDYNGDGVTNTTDGTAMYAALGVATTVTNLVPTHYMDFKDDMMGRNDMTLPVTGTYTASTGTATGNAIYYISDPFGSCYGYSTIKNKNVSVDLASTTSSTTATTGNTATQGNNPTFDLWSTAATVTATTTSNYQTVQQQWVKNW